MVLSSSLIHIRGAPVLLFLLSILSIFSGTGHSLAPMIGFARHVCRDSLRATNQQQHVNTHFSRIRPRPVASPKVWGGYWKNGKNSRLLLGQRNDYVRLFSAVSPQSRPKASNYEENDANEMHMLLDASENGATTSTPSVSSLPLAQEELMEINGGAHIDPKGVSNPDDLLVGLKSRPVPGGNWDPNNPLQWAKGFGSRSKECEEHLQTLIKLHPGDEGYFEVDDAPIPGVTVVRNREHAKIVLESLNQADQSTFHACDTEVMAIDLKEVGPVGNGYVTCVSIYSGPDFDYGLGQGHGTVLWIDNLDDACGVLQEFKSWFENEKHLKVWHNYGFDRHVMWNEGINVKGFGGDTMHMARLQDTSRSKMGSGNGYSLEALTSELIKGDESAKTSMKELFGIARLRKDGSEGSLLDIPPVEVMQRDPRHRRTWIEYSCRDAKGTWKLREILQEKLLQMDWLEGKNLYDYYVMHMRPFGEVLTDMERRGIRVDARDYLAGVETQAREDREYHSRTFRAWAMKMIGPDGLALNPSSAIQLQTLLFGGARNERTGESTETKRVFKMPREEIPDVALEAYRKRDENGAADEEEPVMDDFDHMNAAQLKALCKDQGLKMSGKKTDLQERLRQHFTRKPKSEETSDTGPDEKMDNMTAVQLKALCKELGLKVAGKKAELHERLREYFVANGSIEQANGDEFDSMGDSDLRDALVVRGLNGTGSREELLARVRTDVAFARSIESPDNAQEFIDLSDALEAAAKIEGSQLSEILAEVRAKANAEPKHIDVVITSLGLKPTKYTVGGAPSVTADVLRDLAGDPLAEKPKYGLAYNALGGGQAGHDACVALYSLCQIGSIDTMIANFLTSLQSLADEKSRVHCSLNLNTETGRLSSRRPNLQNQPALEKDKYKIRKAFESSPGNNLIVADYGQLELRLLASMTGCKSMIDAFAAGGDFHSRTALDMFDYVRDKVESGECLLEWDYSQGEPPKPLLKDLFASERRKAKTLNFSIAYGKTAHGLSQDWGVSKTEAENMLQAWYNARPEVEQWQADKKRIARERGFTRTLMGRYRQLPHAMEGNKKLLGHAERASINTPIQGGAADVAMMAMIKINDSENLKRLGWILLLQIHDEVILEGPEETAEEAFKEVLNCMESPWVLGLPKTEVPLLVDGDWKQKNWYDAK